MNRRAFTLIELMVVVAVVGILATGLSCASYVKEAISSSCDRLRLDGAHREKARAALYKTEQHPVTTPSVPTSDPGKEQRLIQCRSMVRNIENIRLGCLNDQRDNCPKLDSVPDCMKRGGYSYDSR